MNVKEDMSKKIEINENLNQVKNKDVTLHEIELRNIIRSKLECQ